ncbi:MAG: hypothetical protein SFY70_11985 [Bacteroidia bacterium]|nr:hypothetical protein [Bacteroidia bacterium]
MELQEVKQQIMERTGLPEDKALSAIAIVMDTLKSRLPDGIASQLDGVLTGQEFSYKELMGDKFDEMKDSLGDKFDDVKDGTQQFFQRLFTKKQQEG